MGQFQDLTGQRFARLTVIKRQGTDRHGKLLWLCECDCGNKIITAGASLKKGFTKSCGCLRDEKATSHGKSYTRLYREWIGIKKRCYNINSKNYYLYGAEGKAVCDEWLNDFNAFYDWSMNNGYADDLTIERKDGTKGYSPDNCCWATPKEQANNRRTNRLITRNGKTQTMKQWAEEIGLPYYIVSSRINKLHWEVEKALTTPAKRRTE